MQCANKSCDSKTHEFTRFTNMPNTVHFTTQTMIATNKLLKLQLGYSTTAFLRSFRTPNHHNETLGKYSLVFGLRLGARTGNISPLRGGCTTSNGWVKSSSCRCFTSATTTESESSDAMVVQVTKTDNASSSSVNANSTTNQEQKSAEGGCCGGGGTSGESESSERMEQEEILAIQTYIKDMHREGNYEEALDMSETLIDKCEKTFGVNHPATASSYNNAAVMHKMLGNYKEARERYQDALLVYKHVVGKDHSSYASTLNNLGNLARSQVQYDDTLTAVERLQLMQSSVDYIQEALQIRIMELGQDHPHTVTSRTNLGGALAAQFLYQNSTTRSRSSSTNRSITAIAITQQQRDMADQHLRTALELAIQNQDKIKTSTATTTVTQSLSKHDNAKKNEEKNSLMIITSLSAAAAAHNLAVFLKVLADQQSPINSSYNTDSMELYLEAKWLYEQALRVRKEKISSQHHHDTIASMSSLAELKAAIGDEEGAMQLRQEILTRIGDLSINDEENPA